MLDDEISSLNSGGIIVDRSSCSLCSERLSCIVYWLAVLFSPRRLSAEEQLSRLILQKDDKYVCGVAWPADEASKAERPQLSKYLARELKRFAFLESQWHA